MSRKGVYDANDSWRESRECWVPLPYLFIPLLSNFSYPSYCSTVWRHILLNAVAMGNILSYLSWLTESTSFSVGFALSGLEEGPHYVGWWLYAGYSIWGFCLICTLALKAHALRGNRLSYIILFTMCELISAALVVASSAHTPSEIPKNLRRLCLIAAGYFASMASRPFENHGDQGSTPARPIAGNGDVELNAGNGDDRPRRQQEQH
jgi:hypothetical protein